MTESQLERFMAKVRVDDAGCWLWTASQTSSGYGQFQLDGRRGGRSETQRRPLPAHVVSYAHFVGAVPVGFHVHHLCGRRSCVNPEHLSAISRLDHSATHAATRTVCRNGHEREPGARCLRCHRENARKHYKPKAILSAP